MGQGTEQPGNLQDFHQLFFFGYPHGKICPGKGIKGFADILHRANNPFAHKQGNYATQLQASAKKNQYGHVHFFGVHIGDVPGIEEKPGAGKQQADENDDGKKSRQNTITG